jgi:hypothetical protein
MKVAQGLHKLYLSERGRKKEEYSVPWDELSASRQDYHLMKARKLIEHFRTLGISVVEDQYVVVQPRVPVLKIGRKKQIITVRTE